jgi:hypothetical protein
MLTLNKNATKHHRFMAFSFLKTHALKPLASQLFFPNISLHLQKKNAFKNHFLKLL